MPNAVPIFNVQGNATPFTVELMLLDPRGDASLVGLRIDIDFAGRPVDEELPLGDLEAVASGSKAELNDVLGLVLRHEGGDVHGLVGVGSGNERFVLRGADLGPVLALLRAEAGP